LFILRNCEVICTVFCDISKAFNKVWHCGVLKKLKACGISGKLLCWFENYLVTEIKELFYKIVFQKWGTLMDRIPLGSALGPLLFILYINDITDDIQSLSRLFADDTSLLFSFSNMNEIEQRINSDRITIYNWLTKWLVDCNLQKTKCILLSTNQGNIKSQILFNIKDVEFVENHKHLGVTISSSCKWHCHIQSILKSTSGQLFYCYVKSKSILTGKISIFYLFCSLWNVEWSY
jgi:hypothetical protein